MFLFSLGRQVYKKYQIHLEIRGLETEIARLESQNQDLAGLLEYFKTTAYKERQARSILNLKKPGEFAVALPPREEEGAGQGPQAEEIYASNFKKWREYFFGRKDE
ncbi:MAG: septum formation initiator family protein [Candidatus Doudnabacteria bacterium]|nr:septum formation initiator family protein [bacterium]MDZ4244051.1 septum formation initiator family protein [Candidatus Doudnabacteria bacterium]